MKAPAKKLSGSTRQYIRQLVTGSGKFSPKQIAKREAAACRRFSRPEAEAYAL
jgi:hypothetical protein